MDAKALYLQAARSRRLARTLYTPSVVAELEAYARALEERAARLEEEQLSDYPMVEPIRRSAKG